MEETNITYYLGAGCSKSTVPIVEQFNGHMSVIDNQLDYYINTISGTKDLNYFKFKDEDKNRYKLFEDLSAIETILLNHASFDTYARILYLRKDYNRLLKFKYALSLYLTFLQLINKTDNRYETFLASIAETDDQGTFKLPSNVNFISWNYDMQIEKAIVELMDSGLPHSFHSIINLMPSSIARSVPTNPILIKLNGTASYLYAAGETLNLIDFLFTQNPQTTIKTLLTQYEYITEKLIANTTFSFAWEIDHPEVIKSRNHAKKIMKETDILVSIGYSFPVFNRKIDQEILNSAKGLRKIYLQNPENSGQLVRLKSLLNRSIEIIPISDVEQFYIPFELV